MKKIRHLDDNQIVEAAIDEIGLDGLLRRHLSECTACRAQKEELQAGLARFAEFSRGEIPLDFRKPKLAAEKSGGGMVNVWRIHPVLSLCAALSVLVLFLTPIVINRDKIFTKRVVYREMLQDEKFMAEVRNLEDDPLPGFYVDISGPGSHKPNVESAKPGAKNDVRPAPKVGLRNA
ncbi:MAG: hypothetical protein P4L43_04355 [Syntrophobacteraceae bacterium]|nr:hypothetical protein [Syntrophobacteraceae bacterium]